MLPLSLSYDHRVVDGADGARFTSHLCMMLSDVRRLLTLNHMTELKKIHIPNIGDFDSVEVIEVMVKVGDKISIEDSLITVESDKASMDIPSPASGLIKSYRH